MDEGFGSPMPWGFDSGVSTDRETRRCSASSVGGSVTNVGYGKSPGGRNPPGICLPTAVDFAWPGSVASKRA